MSIPIHPDIESRLRARAESVGLTVEVYLDHLVRADLDAEDEIEALALEGINSGELIEAGPEYREEKHHRLDARLKQSSKM